jgi:hypothetical protein
MCLRIFSLIFARFAREISSVNRLAASMAKLRVRFKLGAALTAKIPRGGAGFFPAIRAEFCALRQFRLAFCTLTHIFSLRWF